MFGVYKFLYINAFLGNVLILSIDFVTDSKWLCYIYSIFFKNSSDGIKRD